MKTPFRDIREKIDEFLRTDPTASLVRALLTPEAPYDKGTLTRALIAASSMVCIAALAGVTLLALAVLLVALFLLSVILTRVMGIEIGIPAYGFRS